MTTTQSFERQRRDELHQESMAMLAAERAAVDQLTQSYECLALAVRAANMELGEWHQHGKEIAAEMREEVQR